MCLLGRHGTCAAGTDFGDANVDDVASLHGQRISGVVIRDLVAVSALETVRSRTVLYLCGFEPEVEQTRIAAFAADMSAICVEQLLQPKRC